MTRVKETLSKGHFSAWSDIGAAIKKAMANPPSPGAQPDSRFGGYSKTPLPRKLGIKEGSTVALVGAPADFAGTLGSLPEGAVLRSNPRGKRQLTVWFVRTLKELKAAIPRMVEASHHGPVWMVWPKKTSAMASDVSEKEVRTHGLAAGLVDYKICAIDQTWSGLLFALRKRK